MPPPPLIVFPFDAPCPPCLCSPPLPSISQLTPHGPGLFLSQHLSDQLEHPSSPPSSSSSRRGGDRRRAGQSQGRKQERDRGGTSREKGTPASALVLGDLEWGMPEEPCVLMWDGEGVGGVELPEPRPDTRPIGLVVSQLFVFVVLSLWLPLAVGTVAVFV